MQCYPSSARAPRPSSSSSRPSSLKPWQRRGITFPLSSGHFALALVPPSDPEPRGRNLHRGAPESVEPATAQRGEIRSRVVNAAGPRPRHLLSETSRRERLGWPRQRCAYRAWLALCAPAARGFEQLRDSGCVRARARVPAFSALPPLPPPPPPSPPPPPPPPLLSTLVIGTDRNSESF